DFLCRGAAHEVALAFAAVLGLERLHHALRDAQRTIGNRAHEIERDRAAEAAARRTRAMWMIEAEQTRRRRGDIEIAVRAVPAGGEGESEVGSRKSEVDLSFAEPQCDLDGFGET